MKLLRSRLKKELVNLRISKNKIVKRIVLFLIGCGIITIAEFKNNMPEDNILSSGYSVVRSYMAKIDNYANVLNYKYESIESNKTGKVVIHLKNLNFSFLDKIDIAGVSKSDRTIIMQDYTRGGELYPQGICMTDEFVFITSYSGEKTALGECMVFDRLSGEYLVSLGMDKNSHLGGIAYDGKNIWVCNSSKRAIERISYDFIQYVVMHNRGGFVNITNLVEVYKVKNIPSGITFYKDSLYVVTHTKWTNSKMISYVYDEVKNKLESEFVYKLPPKVQGLTFNDEGNIYLSTSYGRKRSSYIKKYTSIYTMTRDVEDCIERIELPPCSEGIFLYLDKLYIIFESAGKKYLEGTDGNGKSIAPLDKILVIDLT